MLFPNLSNNSYYHLLIHNFLKQCKTIDQLHQIHAHTITTTLLSPHFLTKILYSLTTLSLSATTDSSAALLHYAVSVFHAVPCPSTFCYNIIIRAHTLFSSSSAASLSALHFFSEMRRSSVPPDHHSFPFALKACSQLRVLPWARSLHSQLFKFGFGSDLFVINSLIRVYCVSGRLGDAYQVFDEGSHRDVLSFNVLMDGFVKVGQVVKARELFDVMPVRDAVSWGTIISGYAKENYSQEAIRLFNCMVDLELRPDNVALVSTLSACAQLGELEKGKRIHDYIRKNEIRVDSFLSTGLVDLYAKCGCIDSAIKTFESSSEKGLFTWNAMLVGLAMHGHGQLLLKYFSRMIEVGFKPDGVTFLGILVGCSHGGLVDEARKLFDEMSSVFGVPRELKHYGCMADLLGRAGLIEEAIEMIYRMPMGSDVSVWSGLLGGCKIHGNVEIAEQAAQRVMELKPEDGGVYSILANVYANAERWEDVVKIRRCMSGNRVVKKNAGCSLIQLDGVIHEFIAGDGLHSRINEIYLVLNAIREHQCEVL